MRDVGQYPPPPPPTPPTLQPYGVPAVPPPPAAYGSGVPYGSVASPLHATSGSYQYQIPPAPIPPQAYEAQPPSSALPEQQSNPDYYNEQINPPYWSGSSAPGGPSSPQVAVGNVSGSGTYSATAPPPLPTVPTGLGSHNLPPVSPNIGPQYTSSSTYGPPTQYGGSGQPPSLHGHVSSLSIPGMAGLSLGGSSPALQPYQGTYQNISPLPSPSASPISYSPCASTCVSTHDLGSSGFSLGAPLVSPPVNKNSSLDTQDESYDPTPHAKELLACLNHSISRIDPGPLIKILPHLSAAQLVALRAEYKRLFHQVNIAKHIKMQCGTGAFGKVAWAVALGPYESEGWWANSWYQKPVTRNELLIEALLGKTVQEIRKIKKGFKDDKYGNSIERAVKSELSAHKFRGVILMTLDTESGIRDEEPENQGYAGSVWGHAVQAPGVVKMDKVHEDVKVLYEALDGRPGTGETMLMQIILCRSQVHLREVIRWYRHMYGKDLSRLIIKHSPNLVVCLLRAPLHSNLANSLFHMQGESLTHLLSGIIDKPLRDAKLLEEAINNIAASDNPRDDLFISRCVRVHWDREHSRRVKTAYAKKYHRDLVERIKEVTREDRSFRDFLVRMIE